MPRPSRSGALVISLDFELFWGVRDKRTLQDYGSQLLGAREAIPEILDLFEAYGVHATWATVGILFARGRADLRRLAPALRPTYDDPALSPYPAFDALGEDEASDPYHFAPSLIRRIAQTPGQEIATHTFAHYYGLEPGQTLEQYEADLRAALAVAEREGIAIRSLVFPRNQYGPEHIQAAERLGVAVYRGNEDSVLYRPRADGEQRAAIRLARLADAYVNLSGHHTVDFPAPEGIVNLPASRLLRPYARRLRFLEPLKRRRIYKGLEEAAQQGRIFHLWWHPHNFGADQSKNLQLLESVLARYRRLAHTHGMRSLAMGEVVEQVPVKQPAVAVGAV